MELVVWMQIRKVSRALHFISSLPFLFPQGQTNLLYAFLKCKYFFVLRLMQSSLELLLASLPPTNQTS
jgi:hypothetical protein